MGEVQAWQALLSRKRLAAASDAECLFSIFNATFAMMPDVFIWGLH
jgi:hypothetical protein